MKRLTIKILKDISTSYDYDFTDDEINNIYNENDILEEFELFIENEDVEGLL